MIFKTAKDFKSGFQNLGTSNYGKCMPGKETCDLRFGLRLNDIRKLKYPTDKSKEDLSIKQQDLQQLQ